MWRRHSFNAAKLASSLQRVAALKTLSSAGTGGLEGSMPRVTEKQIRSVLDSNKYKYNVGHASFVLQCPFCKLKSGSGRTMFLNKTTGGVVCKPCDVKGNARDMHLIQDAC